MSIEIQDLSVFDKLKAESQIFVAQFKGIAVSDPGSNLLAVEALKQIKAHADLIESKRTTFVKPLNDRVKAANAYAKEIVAPLDAAMSDLKRQVVAYEAALEVEREKERARLEAERIEAERKAEEEMQRVLEEAAAKAEFERRHHDAAAALFGTEAPDPVPVTMDAEAQAEIARLDREAKLRAAAHTQAAYDVDAAKTRNLRTTLHVEAVDLDAVPKEFLIRELNTKAALAAIKAGVTIPGVRSWTTTDLAIGRNTRVPDAALFSRRLK